MPGRLMSKVYLARPATLSGPSSRLTGEPMMVGFSGQAYLFGSAGLAEACGTGTCGLSLSGTSHPPAFHCRFHDSGEGAEAADVAVEAPARLVRRRVRRLLDERHGRHHEARRAEPAHQAIGVAERLLHGVQRGSACETIHRANLLALHLNREGRARIRRPAVDDHRAGTAGAAIADALVAGKVGTRAQRIEERHPRLDFQIEAFAVHQKLNGNFARANGARSGGLRVGLGHARDRRRQAAHAGRLQEVATTDAEALGLLWKLVSRSHVQVPRSRTTNEKDGSVDRRLQEEGVSGRGGSCLRGAAGFSDYVSALQGSNFLGWLQSVTPVRVTCVCLSWRRLCHVPSP